MCGIAGIIARDARKYETNFLRMTSALSHRGPDDSGTHFFPTCALGHTRLEIVDLKTGHQPMLSPVSNAGIAFNGEIYGYLGLRKMFHGYSFRTRSDTEVILALYDRLGEQFVDHLPGMFAFAIWDESRQLLICARDRFGEKPFYYAFGTNGEFLFASEVKSLLASGLVRPVLSRQAVSHFMQRQYVHPHQTVYENISTLPPAHLLRLRRGQLSVEPYWSLPSTDEKIDLTVAQEEFRRLLSAALERELIADVPIGAFLSGGLDSSTIVAVASEYRARMKTFSFGFGNSVNELPYAREVAQMYGTEHTELFDHDAEIGELLCEMQRVYDEPFADSSNIPTYLISKLSREHVKVVLTGDGGDELFAGYTHWYEPLLLAQKKRRTKAGERMSAVSFGSFVLGLLEKTAIDVSNLFSNRKSRRRPQSGSSVEQLHLGQNLYFSDEELLSVGLGPARKPPVMFGQDRTNSVDDAFRMDIVDYLPGDILVKTDRASMAHGLELRAPFLDVEFATFCISLPWRLKVGTRRDKLILREAYSNRWPPSVRRRGKQGFGAPIGEWLRRDSVRGLKDRYLRDPKQKIFSLLSYENTRKYID
ncbi:MAG TPA: asparagine synthase (glutamine-hydrolyzing), partial [Bacteroidota bacterium]